MTDAIPASETKAAFARRLDVSRQYVGKLVSRGLPMGDDGMINVSTALDWLRANTSTAVDNGGEATSLVEAKTRLLLVQVDTAHINLRRLEGSLVDKEDARRAVRGFARSFRDHMLRFPNRYGAQMAAELGVDTATFIATLEARMREALVDASDNPMPFAEAENG